LKSGIAEQVNKLLPYIRSWYYADDDETIEVTIGKLLKENNKTLSTSESCTGGKIAHLITSVPGSSNYFKGGIVAYANEIKEDIVKVDMQNINKYGAVSKEVVEAMAQNTLHLMKTDYAVATSGIAGPDGGTEEKPVGTVWIAVASAKKVLSKKLSLGDNNRERNIHRATLSVMNELRKIILADLANK